MGRQPQGLGSLLPASQAGPHHVHRASQSLSQLLSCSPFYVCVLIPRLPLMTPLGSSLMDHPSVTSKRSGKGWVTGHLLWALWQGKHDGEPQELAPTSCSNCLSPSRACVQCSPLYQALKKEFAEQTDWSAQGQRAVRGTRPARTSCPRAPAQDMLFTGPRSFLKQGFLSAQPLNLPLTAKSVPICFPEVWISDTRRN